MNPVKRNMSRRKRSAVNPGDTIPLICPATVGQGGDIMKTCAFAGHRPEKMPWGKDENSPFGIEFKFRLREALEYLIGRGYTDFLSGGSRGFDLMAAEIILSLREAYPWIRLTMVAPGTVRRTSGRRRTGSGSGRCWNCLTRLCS